jgi:hypothetical protein
MGRTWVGVSVLALSVAFVGLEASQEISGRAAGFLSSASVRKDAQKEDIFGVPQMYLETLPVGQHPWQSIERAMLGKRPMRSDVSLVLRRFSLLHAFGAFTVLLGLLVVSKQVRLRRDEVSE